eukprot:scaffold80358_cov13-Tisochrysis_lutea.AAC.1
MERVAKVRKVTCACMHARPKGPLGNPASRNLADHTYEGFLRMEDIAIVSDKCCDVVVSPSIESLEPGGW